jgi:hypothetical protein
MSVSHIFITGKQAMLILQRAMGNARIVQHLPGEAYIT